MNEIVDDHPESDSLADIESDEANSSDEVYEQAADEFVSGAQGFRDRMMRGLNITSGDVMQIFATVGGYLLYKEHNNQLPLADAFTIFGSAGIFGMIVDAKYNDADVLPQLPRRIMTGLTAAGMLAFGPGIVEGAIDQAKQIRLPDFRPQLEAAGNTVGTLLSQGANRVMEDPRIVLIGMGAGATAAGARKIHREMQEHQPIRTAIAKAVDYRKGATVKSDLRAIRRAGEVVGTHASYHASRLALIGIRNFSRFAARTLNTLQTNIDEKLQTMPRPGQKT